MLQFGRYHGRRMRLQEFLLAIDPQREAGVLRVDGLALGWKQRHLHHQVILGKEGLFAARKAVHHELRADGRVPRLGVDFVIFRLRLRFGALAQQQAGAAQRQQIPHAPS